jgi:geranylgeranyl diphosphate synthase type I
MRGTGTQGGADAAIRYFASRRERIAAALEAIATERGRALSALPGADRAPIERAVEFSLRGKMIRGCLVFLGAEAAGGDALADIAAAMELFQSGLLAHDDIMDRDETRRGAPALHMLYAAEARAQGALDPLHTGEALGICAGDLCYFEAFAILSRALEASPCARRALGLCSEVLSEVAIAQMADLRWGSLSIEPSEAEILAMYRCKTARYSFSLPLAIGALVAGRQELLDPLMKLGESLGILFQLRDDELGLFGDEASTGKGVGSDLREGKKTLFRARLLAAAPNEELPRLAALFGGGAEAGREDIAYVRRLAGELGVARSLRALAEASEEEALAIIRALPDLSPELTAIFEGLVEYVTRRER